jgi:hypothetical protein
MNTNSHKEEEVLPANHANRREWIKLSLVVLRIIRGHSRCRSGCFNLSAHQKEALSWLDKACNERDVRLTLLKVDPRWDLQRSNPGFLAILKRIGLE